ncbi:hypothetical protein ACSSV8_001700 [Roseovarius sp. MBR-79]
MSLSMIFRAVHAVLKRISSFAPILTARAEYWNAFERKIKKLEEDRILIEEQIASAGKPKHTFEESFELAMNFQANPW